MPLRLYNTLTRRLEEFVPADPARVTFYSCGPTVYDDAHIGNFRSFLAADLLRRWLESPLCEVATDRKDPANAAKVHKGPRTVVHVMNITDVGHMTDDAEGGEAGEDRMAVAGRRLAEAKKSGALPPGVSVDPSDPYAIARFYEYRFKEDAEKLGLKVVVEGGGKDARDDDPRRITHTPRATENVEGMKAVIARLLERGYAYVAGGPGSRVVYFDVQKFPAYGRLSGNPLDRLRTGAGGRISAANQSQKRHAADFLLWKEDPRHIMKWPSPWGEGYPGWHIECTVMSAARLAAARAPKSGAWLAPQELAKLAVGDGSPLLDLHSGGEDNIFPHHECELAQSCAAFNESPAEGTFARLWFHARFLLVEGDKMSKSKGNFFTARDLFARGVEPAAIRLELIRTHYRSNANFTMQGLADSQRMVERWRRVAEQSGSGAGNAEEAERCRRAFADAMHDDLNVAAAIGALNTWASGVSTPGAAEKRLLAEVDAVLGVLSLERAAEARTEIGVFTGVAPDPAIEARLRERREARARKDFKRSDAIRDELAAMGYAIKDLAGGKVEVRRG